MRCTGCRLHGCGPRKRFLRSSGDQGDAAFAACLQPSEQTTGHPSHQYCERRTPLMVVPPKTESTCRSFNPCLLSTTGRDPGPNRWWHEVLTLPAPLDGSLLERIHGVRCHDQAESRRTHRGRQSYAVYEEQDSAGRGGVKTKMETANLHQDKKHPQYNTLGLLPFRQAIRWM